MSPQCLIRESVEFPGRHVRFKLSIPDRGIKLCKPRSILGQFVSRELIELPFDIFDVTHLGLFTLLAE